MRRREEEIKLKQVLLQDKIKTSNTFVAVMKEDVLDVLSNYFEIKDDLKTKICIDEQGIYNITFSVDAFRIKNIGIVTNE
ncbi:MAG: cell division topological specificity factor MinE [Clostridia bacterium]